MEQDSLEAKKIFGSKFNSLTSKYFPPEFQAFEEKYKNTIPLNAVPSLFAVDIYMLGATLFECFNSDKPETILNSKASLHQKALQLPLFLDEHYYIFDDDPNVYEAENI